MTRLFGSEFLKLRTIRSPWLILAAGPLLVVLGVIGVAIGGADLTQPATAIKAFGHAGLMSLLSLVFGIMAVAGEYRHKTITDTYLTTPRRGRVVAAKLAVHTAVGLVYGVILAATALVATIVSFDLKGGSVDLSDGGLWRILAGGVIWVALFTVIGVAIGALIPNPAGAIAAALAWIALIEGLVGQVLGTYSRWLPFAAGEALGLPPRASILPQWGGGLVLIGYAAVFMAVAGLTSVRRDVT